MPRPDESVVIAAPWEGIVTAYKQGVQEDRKGHPSHRMAVVCHQNLGCNLHIPSDPCKQKRGEPLRFIGLYAPSLNSSVKQVNDSVGVQEYASYWSFQPGYVPSPNLIWPCYNHFSTLPGGTGFPGLTAMGHCIAPTQHTIHTGGTGDINTFLGKGRHNLLRGMVCEPLASGHRK